MGVVVSREDPWGSWGRLPEEKNQIYSVKSKVGFEVD